MIDADAFAVLLADWCLEVQPNQQILIQTTTLAQEPAAALHRAVLERGAWPLLRLDPPGLDAGFYRHARGDQLDQVAPIQLAEIGAADASVRIEAPADRRALAARERSTLSVARAPNVAGLYRSGRRRRSHRGLGCRTANTPASSQARFCSTSLTL